MGSQGESQNIETATTALSPISYQPDSKTRRYDRQLRLWATSGQNALEAARLLVVGGSATSTSILKNLVLPGIGHYTILDHRPVTNEDAGNNFFLEGLSSVGKNRAVEAVRLLNELNDGVDGRADTRDLKDVLENDPTWLTGFTLIIVHNLEPLLLDKLATFLKSDETYPTLVVVRSAGFLAEFFIQFHEHAIIDSHSETPPSLRIDKPFPALLEHATTLDLPNMDPTDHSHVPYVVLLVRAMDEWKKKHGGPPTKYDDKKAFKQFVLDMRLKLDEENFDEAEAQAYRAWTETKVPYDISALLSDPALTNLTPTSPPFYHLLAALRDFIASVPPRTLPLSATLPDMHTDTKSYIHLQRLYKAQADEDKAKFKSFLKVQVDDAIVDEFVKNAHGLKLMRGEAWGAFDRDPVALANALSMSPKEASIHISFAALSSLLAKDTPTTSISVQSLTAEVKTLLPPDTELPTPEFEEQVSEIARAPLADMPNIAAFMGGLVAQETIKMITKQYVPVKGYCVCDLIGSWTGVVGA